MKVLITGSDGAIGNEIVNQLSFNKKYSLILLSNKKKKRKKEKKSKFKFFYQNLLKPIKLELKPHVVIHCASKHPNSRLGNNMKNIYNTNIKITKNLIKFANKNEVKKIFFLSSIAIYGSNKKKIISEKEKPKNQDLYEKSKFLSEKLFCKKNNKFQTICLRIPGVFTLSLNRDYPLILKILKKVLNHEDIFAYNLNEKFNNILDVTEIVRLINFVLKKKQIKSQVYNFSASKPIKFINVINLIKKKFHSKSKIIRKTSSKKSFIISNRKILKKLDFKTTTTRGIIIRCCEGILKKI